MVALSRTARTPGNTSGFRPEGAAEVFSCPSPVPPSDASQSSTTDDRVFGHGSRAPVAASVSWISVRAPSSRMAS